MVPRPVVTTERGAMRAANFMIWDLPGARRVRVRRMGSRKGGQQGVARSLWPRPPPTCAGVAYEQHVQLAADVRARLVAARHAADEHERDCQLDYVQTVDLCMQRRLPGQGLSQA